MKYNHIRNIFFDILFSLLTCGLYNIYIQFKQIEAINDMLKEERYSFLKWAVFSFLTLGLYHLYHEYVMSNDIDQCLGGDQNLGIISLILSIFGLSLVADAIQQYNINKFYGDETV
jgi:hypothetical protein